MGTQGRNLKTELETSMKAGLKSSFTCLFHLPSSFCFLTLVRTACLQTSPHRVGKAYSDQKSILKMPITCLQANMVEALPQWGKHSQHKLTGANQIWLWYNYNSWPQNLDDTTTPEVEKRGHWIIVSLKWRAIKVQLWNLLSVLLSSCSCNYRER